MLRHPTLEKLQTLRLPGMVKALEEQFQLPDHKTLSFEERLGLLVDRELTERENRRLTTRLRNAKLRQHAALEDFDCRPGRVRLGPRPMGVESTRVRCPRSPKSLAPGPYHRLKACRSYPGENSAC
jgi:IstB-like ATP binding protein